MLYMTVTSHFHRKIALNKARGSGKLTSNNTSSVPRCPDEKGSSQQAQWGHHSSHDARVHHPGQLLAAKALFIGYGAHHHARADHSSKRCSQCLFAWEIKNALRVWGGPCYSSRELPLFCTYYEVGHASLAENCLSSVHKTHNYDSWNKYESYSLFTVSSQLILHRLVNINNNKNLSIILLPMEQTAEWNHMICQCPDSNMRTSEHEIKQIIISLLLSNAVSSLYL